MSSDLPDTAASPAQPGELPAGPPDFAESDPADIDQLLERLLPLLGGLGALLLGVTAWAIGLARNMLG